MQSSSVPPAHNPNSTSKLAKTIGYVALGLVAATYFLMVLGATVRAMDAGLACPDWPLCHGQYFPPFEPILSEEPPVPTPAQMNAEWFHRLLAAMVSFGLLGMAALVLRSGRRDLRRITYVAGGLLAVQILMGAATVLLGNIHYSVAIHLALATAFLLTVSMVARKTLVREGASAWFPGSHMPESVRKSARFMLWLLGTVLMLGAVIATTPGADLVCPSFPACGRDSYEGVGGLVALQLTHRFLALTFLAWVAALAFAARTVPALKNGAYLLAGLTVLQVILGVINVYYLVPIPISAAHLATAVAMFSVLYHWVAQPTAGGEAAE